MMPCAAISPVPPPLERNEKHLVAKCHLERNENIGDADDFVQSKNPASACFDSCRIREFSLESVRVALPLNSLLTNARFVSGYRFSDTASSK